MIIFEIRLWLLFFYLFYCYNYHIFIIILGAVCSLEIQKRNIFLIFFFVNVTYLYCLLFICAIEQQSMRLDLYARNIFFLFFSRIKNKKTEIIRFKSLFLFKNLLDFFGALNLELTSRIWLPSHCNDGFNQSQPVDVDF